MGLRGPRPQPTDLLRRKGSWRANVNRAEPHPMQGEPPCPAWIDEDAKQMWRALVPQLAYMKLLTRADGNAMTRYCQLWSRWTKAELFIQKYGESYPLKDDKGNVRCFMPWPQVATASKLARELGRLEQEFGLTPSARSRLNVRFATPEEAARAAQITAFFRQPSAEPGSQNARPCVDHAA